MNSSIAQSALAQEALLVLESKLKIRARFHEMYLNELSNIPDWDFGKNLGYLSGLSQRYEGKTYQLDKPVISQELYRAMYDLFAE